MEKPPEVFATNLYIYLFLKRIPDLLGAPTLDRWNYSQPCSNFDVAIGKAVLIECYRNQYTFWNICVKFKRSLYDTRSFLSFVTTWAAHFFINSKKDIFDAVMVFSAWVLEASAFAFAYGYENRVWLSDIIWSVFFECYLQETFFEKGGWEMLKEKATDKANLYDQLRLEFITDEKIVFLDGWLNGAEKYFMYCKEKGIEVICMVDKATQTADEFNKTQDSIFIAVGNDPSTFTETPNQTKDKKPSTSEIANEIQFSLQDRAICEITDLSREQCKRLQIQNRIDTLPSEIYQADEMLDTTTYSEVKQKSIDEGKICNLSKNEKENISVSGTEGAALELLTEENVLANARILARTLQIPEAMADLKDESNLSSKKIDGFPAPKSSSDESKNDLSKPNKAVKKQQRGKHLSASDNEGKSHLIKVIDKMILSKKSKTSEDKSTLLTASESKSAQSKATSKVSVSKTTPEKNPKCPKKTEDRETVIFKIEKLRKSIDKAEERISLILEALKIVFDLNISRTPKGAEKSKLNVDHKKNPKCSKREICYEQMPVSADSGNILVKFYRLRGGLIELEPFLEAVSCKNSEFLQCAKLDGLRVLADDLTELKKYLFEKQKMIIIIHGLVKELAFRTSSKTVFDKKILDSICLKLTLEDMPEKFKLLLEKYRSFQKSAYKIKMEEERELMKHIKGEYIRNSDASILKEITDMPKARSTGNAFKTPSNANTCNFKEILKDVQDKLPSNTFYFNEYERSVFRMVEPHKMLRKKSVKTVGKPEYPEKGKTKFGVSSKSPQKHIQKVKIQATAIRIVGKQNESGSQRSVSTESGYGEKSGMQIAGIMSSKHSEKNPHPRESPKKSEKFTKSTKQ